MITADVSFLVDLVRGIPKPMKKDTSSTVDDPVCFFADECYITNALGPLVVRFYGPIRIIFVVLLVADHLVPYGLKLYRQVQKHRRVSIRPINAKASVTPSYLFKRRSSVDYYEPQKDPKKPSTDPIEKHKCASASQQPGWINFCHQRKV